MRHVIRLCVLAVVTLTAMVGVTVKAEASTPYWANTDASSSTMYSFKVKFCDGTTKTLYRNQSTTKNVCALWLPRERRAYVYVWETGTRLFNYADCGSGRWVRFTTATDTSRTANVSISRVSCP